MGNAYTYVYVNIIKYMRLLVIILNVRIPNKCIQYTNYRSCVSLSEVL